MKFKNPESWQGISLENIFWAVLEVSWGAPRHGHELFFKPVANIRNIEIGVCTWSAHAFGNRDLSEVIVYAAMCISGKRSILLATETATTDPQKLAKTVLVPLPKERFWHKRNFEIQKMFLSTEEALQNIQLWVEKRIGITDDQQRLITEATNEAKLRNQVLQELNFSSEEDKEISEISN